MKQKLLVSLMIFTCISASGCSIQSTKDTSQETSNEVIKEAQEQSTEQDSTSIRNLVKDKYVHITDGEDEPGLIYCFMEDKIVYLYGYHGDEYTMTETSEEDGKAVYKLETKEFGEPENIIKCTLTITKNDDGTINLLWLYENDNSTFEEKNLKLLDAKECVQSIEAKYPSYVHDKNWDDLGLTSNLFEKVDESKDKDTSKDTSSDKGTSTDKATSTAKITASQALKICKEKLNGIWSSKNLILGTNKSGLDKIIKINGKEYYCVYFQDEECTGDFRFCINSSTGEVYFQSVADLKALTPIDEYIKEFKESSEDTNSEDTKNEQPTESTFSQQDAINIAIGRFGAVGSGENEAGHELITNSYNVIGDVNNENGMKYYVIEVNQSVKSHPENELSGEQECDFQDNRTFRVNAYENGSCN